MALFNYANREITAKIVYYGPGICGKTTSLQYIHERIAPAQRGRLLSLATETDRTIFFDLLPLKLGEIGGFKLRFQLYTVPGQVKYNKTRKLVLQGADAVVFVADSQVSRREANITSFQNLRDNLQEQNRQLEDLPLVYQFNKRDLKDILSIEDLDKELNPRNLPFFESTATEGIGVMETLEAISKYALDDMEQRLTAGSQVKEPEDTQNDEELLQMMEDEETLLDLTSNEEEALSFSSEELDSLELEPDLSSPESLESKPIGYGNEVAVEEMEIRSEDIARTGTLKESEFFNLKDVEEQALRELDDFLERAEEDEDVPSFSLEDSEEEFSPVEESPEDALDFSLDDGSLEEQPLMMPDSPLEMSGEDERETDERDMLDFSLDEPSQESEETSEFSFSLDEKPGEATGGQPLEGTLAMGDIETLDISDSDLDLSFEEEPETEKMGAIESLDISGGDLDLSFEEELETEKMGAIESLDISGSDLDLSFEEEPETEKMGAIESLDISDSDLDLSFEEEPETEKMGVIEALDISDSDLDLSFEEEQDIEQADDLPAFILDEGEGEEASIPFTTDEDNLAIFDLDEGSSETTDEESGVLNFGEDELSVSPGEEPQKSQTQEFPDFQITDSVRFEMQVGEDMSSVTPFEQQLEQLSEDGFAGEEGQREDEFQPDVSEVTEEEQFQTISDEWTRLIVLAKYFYHRGEMYRAQHTTGDNILAVMMYYTAVDTALKAVALKYETCNPAIASFHLTLESIEEETEKPVAGAQSLINNIVLIKNRIQLETTYPDDEECEYAARISERFLSSLAEDFLTIDFLKLSPVLARME